MLSDQRVTHINSGFVQSLDLRWSGRSYFIFDLRGDHPLLRNRLSFQPDCYIFCHWIGGSGEIVHHQRTVSCREGDVFTFLPNQQYILNAGSDARLKGILVSPGFMERINMEVELSDSMHLLLGHPVLQPGAAESAMLLGLLEQLLYNNCNHDTGLYRSRIQKTGFLMYAYELGALYQKYCSPAPLPVDRKSTLYARFLVLLASNFRRERSVDFYAKQLFVTANYFSETVRAAHGKSAGRLISEAVISEAKGLLEQTRMAVQEIAELLNFPDPGTFTKYFKKETGLSPRSYRDALPGSVRLPVSR